MDFVCEGADQLSCIDIIRDCAWCMVDKICITFDHCHNSTSECTNNEYMYSKNTADYMCHPSLFYSKFFFLCVFAVPVIFLGVLCLVMLLLLLSNLASSLCCTSSSLRKVPSNLGQPLIANYHHNTFDFLDHISVNRSRSSDRNSCQTIRTFLTQHRVSVLWNWYFFLQMSSLCSIAFAIIITDTTSNSVLGIFALAVVLLEWNHVVKTGLLVLARFHENFCFLFAQIFGWSAIFVCGFLLMRYAFLPDKVDEVDEVNGVALADVAVGMISFFIRESPYLAHYCFSPKRNEEHEHSEYVLGAVEVSTNSGGVTEANGDCGREESDSKTSQQSQDKSQATPTKLKREKRIESPDEKRLDSQIATPKLRGQAHKDSPRRSAVIEDLDSEYTVDPLYHARSEYSDSKAREHDSSHSNHHSSRVRTRLLRIFVFIDFLMILTLVLLLYLMYYHRPHIGEDPHHWEHELAVMNDYAYLVAFVSLGRSIFSTAALPSHH